MDNQTVAAGEALNSRRNRRRLALITSIVLAAASSVFREANVVQRAMSVSTETRDDRKVVVRTNRSVSALESSTRNHINRSAVPGNATGKRDRGVLNAAGASVARTVNTSRAQQNGKSPSFNAPSGDLDMDAASRVATPVPVPVPRPWAALCAVMRDEDLYIDEWTDYHLALGFEHIFIYDSHPNFTLSSWYAQRQKQELEDEVPNNTTASRVHLTHRVLPDTGPVQELVYGECLAQLRALPVPPKWVMVLDGDEYLVFRDMERYPNVTTFLTEHLQSGSLQINWIVMGSANETEYRAEPVTKRFQLALSGSHYPETKAVAVLDHITGWRVHYVYHKPGFKAIGMGGRKVGLAGALCCIKDGDVSVAAVYHYKFKSYGEFNHKQCERGDIYKKLKHTCPATVETGDLYDDSAWRAMTRLLPKYGAAGKSARSLQLARMDGTEN